MKDTSPVAYYSERSSTLGDRIVAAREARGSSQSEIANWLGVKLKTVQNWEDDQVDPRANKAQMLSGTLGVSLAWLLTGEGGSFPESRPLMKPSVELEEVLMGVRRLNSDVSQSVRKLAALEKRLIVAVQSRSERLGTTEAGRRTMENNS